MPTIRSIRRIAAAAAAGFALASCSGSDTAAPPSPAALSAVGSATSSATVGTAAATPTVRVLDNGGSPIAGVSVAFAITAGGGAIGRTAATTDATGTASAGSWTLGTAAGTNTVDATVAGLPAVRFTATGTAGAAASIAIASGDGQSASVGATVATAPAVIVKDQYGNPVAGATVAFSVMSGGGAVTGASVTTGTDGIARLTSWTLGVATGSQQLRATVGALATTISATASVPTGCTVTNYALGATLPLAWDASDCTSTGVAGVSVSGRRYDRLQFTTTAQQQVEASVTGPSGRALLLRNATTGLYVGLQPSAAFSPAAQNPMRHRYVLAPGSYVFEPYAPDAVTTGAYTFATTTGATVSCDYIVFATTGVQFTDSVKNKTYNCTGPTGFMEQWVNLQLKAGTKVRITLSNTDFPALLVFRDDRLGPASPTLVTKQGTAGQTLTIDWTATFDTWHEIVVAPLNAAGGKYTLKIEELP